jgi:hypothetical protein
LTNANFYEKAVKDFKEEDQRKIKVVRSPQKLKVGLSKVLKGETILFEGRETRRYLPLFKKV